MTDESYPKYSPEHAYALEAEVERWHRQSSENYVRAERAEAENERLQRKLQVWATYQANPDKMALAEEVERLTALATERGEKWDDAAKEVERLRETLETSDRVKNIALDEVERLKQEVNVLETDRAALARLAFSLIRSGTWVRPVHQGDSQGGSVTYGVQDGEPGSERYNWQLEKAELETEVERLTNDVQRLREERDEIMETYSKSLASERVEVERLRADVKETGDMNDRQADTIERLRAEAQDWQDKYESAKAMYNDTLAEEVERLRNELYEERGLREMESRARAALDKEDAPKPEPSLLEDGIRSAEAILRDKAEEGS
jgi:hypothetical protein